jgi:hypothetical protein
MPSVAVEVIGNKNEGVQASLKEWLEEGQEVSRDSVRELITSYAEEVEPEPAVSTSVYTDVHTQVRTEPEPASSETPPETSREMSHEEPDEATDEVTAEVEYEARITGASAEETGDPHERRVITRAQYALVKRALFLTPKDEKEPAFDELERAGRPEKEIVRRYRDMPSSNTAKRELLEWAYPWLKGAV